MNYVCAWFSPRGFANEGIYFYGTYNAWREFCRPLDASVSRWCVISRHRTLEAAQARANKEVRMSERRTGWGEQDYTHAAPLGLCALAI